MKRFVLLFVFSFLLFSVFSQEKATKDGWGFGALPTVSFDTDLGFQYGGLVNMYHYGDGSRYPTYNHSIYLEISRYTKGSGVNRFYYDSDRLIKGLQTSVDISYLSDQAYDFYGFNGYDAVVNREWFDDESPDYRTRVFYKYDRKMFRFKVDLLGNLSGDKLKWAAGINFLHFTVGSVDIDRLNKGKDDDLLPPIDEQPGLYEKYRDAGVFSKEEADGGFVPVFKGGLVYDTRDNRPNPMKGMWTEAVLIGAPEFLGGESSFAKISLTHRQYFTIIPDDLSLAYRLAYQTTLGGDVPFYYQSQVITSVMKGASSEGLGGARSLRGIRRNRIVGDGFFYGNIEARWKAVRFNIKSSNFYIGINGFLDFGKVTKKIDVNYPMPANTSDVYEDYFDTDAEQFHLSYGGGLKFVMNYNFILSIDYGMAADKRDGDTGLYINLNYLF